MSHQDCKHDIVANHETLKQVIDRLLVPAVFAGMKTRKGATWKPRMLAAAAIFWALAESANLKDRFDTARKTIRKIFRWQAPPGETYQGFMYVLRKWHGPLLAAIRPSLRQRIKESRHWEVAGYVLLGGDGSRMELARTESLEKEFSPQRKKSRRAQSKASGQHGAGKGRPKHVSKTAQQRTVKRQRMKEQPVQKKQSAASIAKKGSSPQMWLTLLWHVGVGLPWSWRTGPSDSSERAHLQEMLPETPENTLFAMDAGFVGYEFWSTILDARRSFLVRVGANVSLLQQLGYAREHEHTVYLWPDSAARRNQPPLVLRLIVIHDGKHPLYLVTNLTKTELTDRQAAQIYAARWGIELFFRTFKQTFDRRKLRSHTAENAQLEVDWSLIGLWSALLVGQRELELQGEDPTRLSAAAVIRAFQITLREYRLRPENESETLWGQLRAATLDSYERTSSKASRDYPRKKHRHNIGKPNITRASKQQVHTAAQLKYNQLELRLSA